MYVVEEWILEKTDEPDYIFVEYGLNDYFEQETIENDKNFFHENTYKGGLRSGIKLLMNATPNAKIILIGPTTIQRFDFGRENISGEGSLLDYEEAIQEIADEIDITIIKNYDVDGLEINEIENFIELDQCHLNQKGMYICGRRISELLIEMK